MISRRKLLASGVALAAAPLLPSLPAALRISDPVSAAGTLTTVSVNSFSGFADTVLMIDRALTPAEMDWIHKSYSERRLTPSFLMETAGVRSVTEIF